MSGLEVIAVIGLIGYIIYRQVKGEPLRGRRAVVLPAVLAVIGFMNLRSGGGHLGPADVFCLVLGTAGSAAIGLAFGAITRLQSRDGYLWAQLPLSGLWLWAAMIGWRVLVMLLATGMHAHVAASSSVLLLSLGINRLAQAAVIVPRAMAMGVPFAPEKNGRAFMAQTFNRSGLGDRFNEARDSFGRDDNRFGGASNRFNGADRFNGYDRGNGYDAAGRYDDRFNGYEGQDRYDRHGNRNHHDRHNGRAQSWTRS
jgi:hypothetical protein